MDAFVLDAHHDAPPRVGPVDGRGQRRFADHAVHHAAHPVAVVAHRLHRGPVVIRLVQVVPAHFVHADREHRFQSRIQPFADQPGQQQLVHEEGCGVAEIENERMAQRDRLAVPGLFAGQHFEQLLVAAEGGVEVVAQGGAQRVRIGRVETGRTGEEGVLVSVHVVVLRVEGRPSSSGRQGPAGCPRPPGIGGNPGCDAAGGVKFSVGLTQFAGQCRFSFPDRSVAVVELLIGANCACNRRSGRPEREAASGWARWRRRSWTLPVPGRGGRA